MVIVKYNENWPEDFERIAGELRKSLSSIKTIEHVGSTSIPGMYAKPVIDMDVVVKNNDAFKMTKNELEKIHYEYCGNLGIKGREAFKYMGKSSVLKMEHHLYVCLEDADELKRHIIFRDRLRNNDRFRDEYNRIKIEILKKTGENNRPDYVEMKEKDYKYFFEKVISGQ